MYRSTLVAFLLAAFTTTAYAQHAVVYVSPTGAHLTGGPVDDSANWISSAISYAGYGAADIPAFEGTAEEWAGMMQCAQSQFAGLPIDLVDQPPAGDHQTMLIGGTAAHAGKAGIWGQAPSVPGRYTDRAIGFVFSADHNIGNRTFHLCQSLAHEIGHMLGVEHTNDCRDIMSNDRSCEHVGFSSSTREELAKGLATWGAVAKIDPQVRTGIAAPLQTELLVGSGAVTARPDGTTYWPISVQGPKPIAYAVLNVVTADNYVGVYHCLADADARCAVRDGRVEGGYPGPFMAGTYHQLIEVTYVDGTKARSPWFSMQP